MVHCPLCPVTLCFWVKNAFGHAMSTLREIRTYECSLFVTFGGHRVVRNVCGSFLTIDIVYGHQWRAMGKFWGQKGVSGQGDFRGVSGLEVVAGF